MNGVCLEKVTQNMERLGLKQLLITAPMSIKYLTGRYTAPGERLVALMIKPGKTPVLAANSLFALKAIEGLELMEYSDTENPAQLLSELTDGGVLGVDKDMPCRFLLPLTDLRPDVRPVIGSPAVDMARMLKTEAEIELMAESSRLNDIVLKKTIAEVSAGMSEKDVAACYVRHAVEAGADGESFDSLICFGASCAEPHPATAGDKIKDGDSVILDVGLKYKGYCSDMTRTIFFGTPTEEQKRVYDIVLAANAAGKAAVKPGVPLKEIDRAARKVIEEGGYGEYFIHRTGHGIGLEVHEPPDNSATSRVIAKPGMCFSVEPGIYLPGKFGVRIEDLVAVTEDGCETLNALGHELTVVSL